MKIRVNGRDMEVPGDFSLAALLEDLAVGGPGTAVEVNREIIPRGEYREKILNDGDRVEIITMVGGG